MHHVKYICLISGGIKGSILTQLHQLYKGSGAIMAYGIELHGKT